MKIQEICHLLSLVFFYCFFLNQWNVFSLEAKGVQAKLYENWMSINSLNYFLVPTEVNEVFDQNVTERVHTDKENKGSTQVEKVNLLWLFSAWLLWDIKVYFWYFCTISMKNIKNIYLFYRNMLVLMTTALYQYLSNMYKYHCDIKMCN